MRYFICTVNLEHKIIPRTENGEAEINQLVFKGLSFHDSNRKGFLGCVTFVYESECRFVFAGNGDDAEFRKEAEAFRDFIGAEGSIRLTEETCAAVVRKELTRSAVHLPPDITEQFDVDARINADEHIARPASGCLLSDYAQQHHFPELKAEAERIRACSETRRFLGHPVHYILEENDPAKAAETIDLLTDTLYRAGRLQSPRIIVIDPETFRRSQVNPLLSHLYENFTGGTICLSADPEGNHGEYADGMEELIESVCKFAKQYAHEVLTIFHIPQHHTEARRAISASVGNELVLLTFSEEQSDYHEACEYMELLCKRKNIDDPSFFIEQIDPEQTVFYTAEIDAIFREHYKRHLIRTHFPVYENCRTPAAPERRAEGKAADTLNEMIGLGCVKRVIEESVSYYKLQKVYRERHIVLNAPARSMVFTGNPGTAKTTVARLTAKIFKENGLIESGNIVEVGRADLVGKYVGWTATIVKDAFKRAKGSVLFIDEAYSLVDDRDGLYGDEAINTIVQEMENHRDDTIVIFAGYPDKMDAFLKKNPGLRSRIAFHVDFPDYTPDELLDILRLMAKTQSMKLDRDAEKAALSIFRKAVQIPDFGNGRFARNVLEQAQMRLSMRLTSQNTGTLTFEQLTTLCAEDFIMPVMCSDTPERRVIGF